MSFQTELVGAVKDIVDYIWEEKEDEFAYKLAEAVHDREFQELEHHLFVKAVKITNLLNRTKIDPFKWARENHPDYFTKMD